MVVLIFLLSFLNSINSLPNCFARICKYLFIRKYLQLRVFGNYVFFIIFCYSNYNFYLITPNFSKLYFIFSFIFIPYCISFRVLNCIIFFLVIFYSNNLYFLFIPPFDTALIISNFSYSAYLSKSKILSIY